MIGQPANSVVDHTVEITERKVRAILQTGASRRICHEANSEKTFRAIKHLHQCDGDVVTVGDQFAHDFRFAQSELKQTGHAMSFATARRRHAIESVCDVSHAMCKGGAAFFVPGVAVPAAYLNI